MRALFVLALLVAGVALADPPISRTSAPGLSGPAADGQYLRLDGTNTGNADSTVASGGEAWILDTTNAFAAGSLFAVKEQGSLRWAVSHDGRIDARYNTGTTFFDTGTTGTSYASITSAVPNVRVVTAGGYGSNSSQAGVNFYVGSAVNAAGEYASVAGTTDTATTPEAMCFGSDVDGSAGAAVITFCIGADGTINDGNLTSGVVYEVDIVPSASGTRALGSAALDWANVYALTIQAGTAGTVSIADAISVTGNVRVSADNTYDLGLTGTEYKDGYFAGTVYTSTIADDDDATVLFNDSFFSPTTDATGLDSGSSLGGAANRWAILQSDGWISNRYIGTTVTLPTCSAGSGLEGTTTYVDDTDDAFPGGLCFCGQSAAAVYGWYQVADRTTACP